MGQVPRAKSWLLLGDGRLATHLATYLRRLGIPLRRWSRHHGWQPSSPHSRVANEPLADGFARHDRVLVALADDALAGFVDRYRRPGGPGAPPWVHFSGSRRIEGARRAHPLCSFGPRLLAPDIYPTVPFLLEENGPELAELLPGLPNPSARVPERDAALYHALCVMSGNFTTLLWQRFFTEIETRWDLDPSFGMPYLRSVAENLQAPDPSRALTGPIARGDDKTIAGNLDALRNAELPDLAALYESFLRAARPEATETAA